jgi:CRAL/TRIO domain/CRAL/TRIO, N-terminal domain
MNTMAATFTSQVAHVVPDGLLACHSAPRIALAGTKLAAMLAAHKCRAKAKSKFSVHADGSTLLRFLRAREYDVQKATTMYVNHLKWRKENGIDTILEDFDFKEREQYLAVYPQGYYNVDKEGRPVTIQHLGQVNPKRINQVTTEERMIKYHVQEYERFLKKMAPTCSQLQGRHIDSSTAILDVKGMPS